MVLGASLIARKRKLLAESYVLIERLKKLRALNADPRLVGMSPHVGKADSKLIIVNTDKS